MPIFNIYEAKTQLSKLIDMAVSGSDVIIARNSVPIARIAPINNKDKRMLGFGALEGKGWIADDFDAPLPEDFLIRPDGE